MTAVSRTAPLASLTVTGGAVTSYHGRNGSGGVFAPAVQVVSTGLVKLTWNATYASELFRNGLAVAFPWVIRTANASGHWNANPVVASFTQISATVIQIETRKWNGSSWALSNETVSLRVFGEWLPEARIGDYDGATDKVDCSTETEPYAWLWYQEYTAMLGSGFSSQQSGIVHAKKLTLARFEAGKTRAAERARCNAIPSTADDCLGLWVQALAVPYRESDQRWQIRQRCAAKYKGALGPTQANVDAALAELLGARYTAIALQIGSDLERPPSLTFWPGINPGPAAMDLGGGCWSSERAHLTVLLVKPPPTQLSEFLYQANVAMFQQLDRMLPAKMTFNWATSAGRFLLDISQLDFDAL
jgi:hypothetical protein